MFNSQRAQKDLIYNELSLFHFGIVQTQFHHWLAATIQSAPCWAFRVGKHVLHHGNRHLASSAYLRGLLLLLIFKWGVIYLEIQ